MTAKKIEPLPPTKVKLSLFDKIKLSIMSIISVVLWVVMIGAAINVLLYYLFLINTKGFFSPETITYAVVIAVGSYFCLILDKNKIYEALNIKSNLPYINPKDINIEGKK